MTNELSGVKWSKFDLTTVWDLVLQMNYDYWRLWETDKTDISVSSSNSLWNMPHIILFFLGGGSEKYDKMNPEKLPSLKLLNIEAD